MERIGRRLRDEKGFTLIEMALVLVIIGIIIGAVVKGKDLIKSAEQKKIYTKYLGAWNLAYLGFYDRTGLRLGDTWNTDTNVPGQDGRADTTNAVGGEVTNAGRDALLANGALITFYGLTDIGLERPTTNMPKEWQYKYTDSVGTAHDMSISFKNAAVDNYNYMFIERVPGELAVALDTMIDGAIGATTGGFIAASALDATQAVWTEGVAEAAARWRMEF